MVGEGREGSGRGWEGRPLPEPQAETVAARGQVSPATHTVAARQGQVSSEPQAETTAATNGNLFGNLGTSDGSTGVIPGVADGGRDPRDGSAEQSQEPSGESSAQAEEPEDAEAPDTSSDNLQAKAYPGDQSPLSEIERQSVVDSIKGFVKFAKERLLSLAADHVVPGAGRLVDLWFKIQDVVDSVRALAGDDPVLEAPLPSPVPSLDFTLEIPLTSGEDSQAALPLALCVAPHSPSLTGGWALDAVEHDDLQVKEPPADAHQAAPKRFYSQQDPASWSTATIETRPADQPEPLVRRRSATACLVEIDLDSLLLSSDRKRRAEDLSVLAAEYASRLRENPGLGRFELFIIADKGRRCGLWIWLNVDIEIGRRSFEPELGQS